MAKQTTTKKRPILIRDIDNETSKALEFFKNKNGFKTNSKAVVYMINRVEHYLEIINKLENDLETSKEKANRYWEVLDELKNAQSTLNNFNFDE